MELNCNGAPGSAQSDSAAQQVGAPRSMSAPQEGISANNGDLKHECSSSGREDQMSVTNRHHQSTDFAGTNIFPVPQTDGENADSRSCGSLAESQSEVSVSSISRRYQSAPPSVRIPSPCHSLTLSIVRPTASVSAIPRSASGRKRDFLDGEYAPGQARSVWHSSCRQKAILCCTLMSTICSFMCLGIMAPFFPQEVSYSMYREADFPEVVAYTACLYSLQYCMPYT